jgi:hypothetical protein
MLFDNVEMNMAIYTRWGVRVNLLSADLIPVWIEQRRGEIKWHYSEPRRTKQTVEVERVSIWHVTAEYAEHSKDGSCKPGMKLWYGRSEPTNSLVADDGIREINNKCRELNPAHAAKEDFYEAA